VAPEWKDQDNKKIAGLGVEDLYWWLVREYAVKASKEDFLALCHGAAREIYEHKVTQTEGLVGLLETLKDRNIPLALASSSPQAWIDMVLKRFDLQKWFQAVVSADQVGGKGKPSPEIHLRAARLLGMNASDCCAIEDSHVGVLAAKRAGMFCLGFRNGFNGDQDLSTADAEISSLNYESLISRLKAP
jgi:HAD superfamily hydrolase (TIGR01509 family)